MAAVREDEQEGPRNKVREGWVGRREERRVGGRREEGRIVRKEGESGLMGRERVRYLVSYITTWSRRSSLSSGMYCFESSPKS